MLVIHCRWLIVHGGRTIDTLSNPISDMYVYDTKRWTWNKVKYGLGKLLRLLYNIVEYLNELITN